MRWGKIVLLFQAIVTLILGIVFFSQVLSADIQEITQPDGTDVPPIIQEINQLKTRYTTAAYILLFVSLIEIIIISRLLSQEAPLIPKL